MILLKSRVPRILRIHTCHVEFYILICCNLTCHAWVNNVSHLTDTMSTLLRSTVVNCQFDNLQFRFFTTKLWVVLNSQLKDFYSIVFKSASPYEIGCFSIFKIPLVFSQIENQELLSCGVKTNCSATRIQLVKNVSFII